MFGVPGLFCCAGGDDACFPVLHGRERKKERVRGGGGGGQLYNNITYEGEAVWEQW